MKWEYFCDESYYDMWAVRETGETRWGHCFHLNSKKEAESLCGILNQLEKSGLKSHWSEVEEIL